MGLDNRSREILLYLLQHPTKKSSEIMEHFSLSKRQFNYSFDKINEYLQDNYIEKISRTKRGIFVIPSMVYTQFNEGVKTAEKEYIYSEKERQSLIILSILAREEELSLLHMSDITKVSKNTVLNDMKEVQQKANEYHLTVTYDRKNGYHLEGTEIDKRYMMIEIVREISKIPNAEQLYLQICRFTHKDMFDIMNRIILIEKSLDIRISDERLNELRYIVLLSIRRIQLGKILRKLPTDFYSVNGTYEYEKTQFILRDTGYVNEEENIFMTLQILISNISNMNEPILVCHENIYGLVESIIENFEQIGCVKFHDKKGLCNFLFQHFKPAYFRIKYNFHIENEITDIVLNEYYYLQEIIEQAIAPIEKIMGKKFPKSEVFYILIIIGGWLRKELQEYFYHGGVSSFDRSESLNQEISGDPSFAQVLPYNHFFMEKKLNSWEDALRILSAPLLEKGYIEQRYVKEIQTQIITLHPYIMVANGFVILHAGVNDGVHEVAMSLLKVEDKVSIEGYLEADILLMLATPDTKIHLRALNQMLDKLVKEKRLTKIRKAKSIEQMYQGIFQN